MTSKVTSRFLTSLSIAAIAMSSSSPAFAYITRDLSGYTPDADTQDSMYVPGFSPFHEDAGSGFRNTRGRLTSRAIERAGYARRKALRGWVGDIRVYGGERDAASRSEDGRSYLPARAQWRWAFLRNNNRHRLGHSRPGSHWRNVSRYHQGDDRRSPLGLTSVNLKVPTRLFPGGGTETAAGRGGGEGHPNWRRWARGNEDSSKARNLDIYTAPNRYFYDKVPTTEVEG